MDKGLFPYTKRYLGTLRNHFSTLGVNGINEMIRNFTGDADDITTEWGHAFALRLLDHVRARIVRFQEETGHMYNLEATPGRRHDLPLRTRGPASASRTFCRPARTTSPITPTPANSRSGFTDDPFEALGAPGRVAAQVHRRHRPAPLHGRAHLLGDDACKKLVRRALENSRLPYITITPTFSDLPQTRLPRWRTYVLPQVRCRTDRAQAVSYRPVT